MQCPKCNAVYENTDSFCMSCGTALQKRTENGRILLTRDDLAAMAGSNTYTQLSPLAAYYQETVEKTKTPVMEPLLLDAILSPERAFFLIEFTRDSFRQDVLLLRNSSYYRWEENASGVSISKETNPRDFIKRVTALLAQCIVKQDTSSKSIKKELLKTLAAVAVLCRELSAIDEAASFITMSHLESFIGSGEGLPAEIAELSQQGFIRCIGDPEPLIMLEKKGEALFLLLNEYERYFIVQVLTDVMSDYLSLNFAAREGTLCLITNPRGSDDLVTRGIDSEGIAPLINWAWTAGL
jgi:hypothetical protein